MTQSNIIRRVGNEDELMMDWPCGLNDMSQGDLEYLAGLCAADYRERPDYARYYFVDAVSGRSVYLYPNF